MTSLRSIAVRMGIIGGVLFSVHICIPGCGNYPFIWPAVAGAGALWVASHDGAVHRLRHGLLTALATGGIVALVGLVAISLILFVVGHSQVSAAASTSGLAGRFLIVVQAGSMIATFCALAMVAAILGALAPVPVMWLRDRRSGATAA